MLQRQNDNREGLLGFANDIDNYGTLYMINNKGKAQIPIARTKNKLLFNGVASVVGDYTLSDTIDNYSLIIIAHGYGNTGIQSAIYTVDTLKFYYNKGALCNVVHGNSSVSYYSTFIIHQSTLTVSAISTEVIYQIYGIY
jgi:hypothetical protein